MEETDRDRDAGNGGKIARSSTGDGEKTAGRSAGKGKKAADRSSGSGKKTAVRGKSAAGKTAGGKTGSGKKASGRKKTAAVRRGGRKSTTQSIAKSFGHAFDGMLSGLDERNMKIHCTMAALVVFFGLVLHISVTEWCICLVLFGLIMGLELVNTAIEAAVDLVTEEYRPLAKRAKDAAAGAVLIASIMAAAAGLIIFIPRLLYFIRSL